MYSHIILDINANDKIAKLCGVEDEELIQVSIDYEYDYCDGNPAPYGDTFANTCECGYEVSIAEVFYNDIKITECFSDEEFRYLEDKISEEV